MNIHKKYKQYNSIYQRVMMVETTVQYNKYNIINHLHLFVATNTV